MNQTKEKKNQRENNAINSSNSKEKQSRLTLAIAESVLGFGFLVIFWLSSESESWKENVYGKLRI